MCLVDWAQDLAMLKPEGQKKKEEAERKEDDSH
jgi:hypothetical protein